LPAAAGADHVSREGATVTEMLTKTEVEDCGRVLEQLGFRVVTGSGGSWADADIWLDLDASRYAALTWEAEQFMRAIELVKDLDEESQERAWCWAMDVVREIVPADALRLLPLIWLCKCQGWLSYPHRDPHERSKNHA
jgi:hypothetical protein